MIARSILIEGKVQGVYYREWAVQTAQELDVAGWVRNLADGRVEAYAVGEAGSVERFIERLREGSPASEVAQVVTVEAPVEELHVFMRRQSERQAVR
jgi:acylphosphatase